MNVPRTVSVERIPFLQPLFWITRLGLAFLCVFRDLIHRPDRTALEGPPATLKKRKITVTRAADLPSHRYEFGAAAVGNGIYVAGGVFQSSVWLPTARFERYDTTNDRWSDLPDLPYVVHHPGVAADGSNVYVAGGCGVRIEPRAGLLRFDTKSNRWDRLPDMPTRRGALGLAYLKGKLYAIGGADYRRKYAIVEAYDIAADKWEPLRPMGIAREHLAVAVVGGKIHALGGYNTDRFGALSAHEVYDPGTDRWSLLPDLPMRLCGFAACGVGDRLYVFAGEQGWAVSPYVFMYDTKTSEWYRLPDLSEARYASGIAVAGTRIHLIGGNTVMFSDRFSRRHDVFTP